MRLIDADALMEQPVWLCGGWVGDSYAEGYMDALDKVEETVRSAPTIDATPKWIPCDERLPREKEVVLITNSKGNVRCGQFRGTSGKYWFWKGNTLEIVEAWMPLPEPYEGERKDDE